MGENDNNLLVKLRNAINGTVEEFRAQPLDFLCETDIQSLLFANLRHEMRNNKISMRAKDTDTLFHHPEDLHINPVKTEYPPNVEGVRERFDVAVLEERQDPEFRIWWQPCRIAVEVKYWQAEGTGAGPWDDIEKLERYRKSCNEVGRLFTGVSMLFVQPGAEKWIENLRDTPSTNDIPEDGVSFWMIQSTENAHNQ